MKRWYIRFWMAFSRRRKISCIFYSRMSLCQTFDAKHPPIHRHMQPAINTGKFSDERNGNDVRRKRWEGGRRFGIGDQVQKSRNKWNCNKIRWRVWQSFELLCFLVWHKICEEHEKQCFQQDMWRSPPTGCCCCCCRCCSLGKLVHKQDLLFLRLCRFSCSLFDLVENEYHVCNEPFDKAHSLTSAHWFYYANKNLIWIGIGINAIKRDFIHARQDPFSWGWFSSFRFFRYFAVTLHCPQLARTFEYFHEGSFGWDFLWFSRKYNSMMKAQ